MRKNQIIAIGLLAVLGLFMFGGIITKSCKTLSSSSNSSSTETPSSGIEKANFKAIPAFNADSAYAFIEKQVAYGPRIPGSPQHQNCSNWIQAKLRSYGGSVSIQPFVGEAYDGVKRKSHNIIASFNPKAAKRILLAAHYDTRPLADQDNQNKTKPILGAIDGASGVAVALEIARGIKNMPLADSLGLDIIFFDNEDNGTPDGVTPTDTNKNYWCLGSQYWAANRQPANYSAYFGILLDMVGGKGTYFQREGFSDQYATSINDLVWNTAAALGYSSYFRNEKGSSITDDHLPVNEVAHLPMIDIISSNGNGFGAFWHTHADNLSSVSKDNMKAVGHTVMQVLYNEQ
jgi:glutaminyl-peptide cyclotransferase